MYVLSLSVIKNFIMILDVRKGCAFVQWRPRYDTLTHSPTFSLTHSPTYFLTHSLTRSLARSPAHRRERTLSLLGKDFTPGEVGMTEFLIDEPYMSLVGADAMGNLETLSYAPGNLESWKGQKLICSGRVHTGRSGIRGIRLKIPVRQSLTHSLTRSLARSLTLAPAPRAS